jgi:CHASE3 domain sensor protein
MSISSKDSKILVILVGILAVVAVYFFVYKPTLEKNTALESENSTLSQRVDYLKSLVAKEEEYRSETDRMNAEVSQMLVDFPSYLMIENEIMNVVDSEGVSNADIASVTVGDPTLVDVASNTTSELSGEEATTVASSAAEQYSLFDMNTSISYTASYEGMKQLINFVAGDKDKHSVSTFTATLDNSTGYITGVMDYDAYFIFGQDKDYVSPDIPNIEHGTENIFGSTIEKDSSKGTAVADNVTE